MFTKNGVHFVLMTVAAAISAAVAASFAFDFMLSFRTGAELPNAEAGRIAAFTLLVPFGAALWMSPNARATLEAGCLGLLTGFGFSAYALTLGPGPRPTYAREYFLQQGHLIEIFPFVSAFVGMAIASGFVAGYGILLLGVLDQRLRRKVRSRR